MSDYSYDEGTTLASPAGDSDDGPKRQTKEQKLQAIFETSLKEFNAVEETQRDERKQCLQDRRFYSVTGGQWEGPLTDQFENRPKFEFNKVHLAVIRIINEYRNNSINVTFVPTDVEGAHDELSDSIAGMFRADENTSHAKEAKDNAFEEAVGGGIGAWRLRACFINEDAQKDKRQHVIWEPIYDADSSVYFNLGCKRQDKSDATRCWVLTPFTYDEFEERWEEDPSTWPRNVHQNEFDWTNGKIVHVAEYYVIEKKKQNVNVFRTLDGEEEEYTDEQFAADPELRDQLLAIGHQLSRVEKRARPRVHKYFMSGCGILEDCGYIAGPNIPIIMAYGKRWVVDNVERAQGHVRLAKDVQRLKNMQMSKLAELSTAAGSEKPVFFADEMTPALADLWAKDTIDPKPFLLRQRVKDVNGNFVPQQLEYTKSPNIPPATAALLQITDQDMGDLLGNQEAGEELQSNISGIAVELIQAKLDMQTFIYITNMETAVARSAEVWLGMAKEIYVEDGRKVRTVSPDGAKGVIQLNKPIVDSETAEVTRENDISEASMTVDTNVGPPSSSRRSAIVRNLLGIKSISADDPETSSILTAYAIMNMEGEGLGDLREWARQKLVKAGVVKPTDDEKKQLEQAAQSAQPDPQAQFLQASAAKALADSKVSEAKATNLDSDTATKLVAIDHAHEKQIIATFEHLDDAQAKAAATAAQQVPSANQPAQPTG